MLKASKRSIRNIIKQFVSRSFQDDKLCLLVKNICVICGLKINYNNHLHLNKNITHQEIIQFKMSIFVKLFFNVQIAHSSDSFQIRS